MSEWQLLLDSEGIEIGDEITVEFENGHQVVMKLNRYTEKSVTLKDKDEHKWKFDSETLESEDGYPIIVGKT